MGKIKDHAGFLKKLMELNSTLYELFEICREEELAPYSEDGCCIYDEATGKCCFQVAGQFKRPGEFLDVLLDMIRVTYEPSPLGTLFLNSNPGFFYEALAEAPFTLGYLSAIGAPGESFRSFWEATIVERLKEYGYALEQSSALFIVVAGGCNRVTGDLIDEVHETANACFTVDEVFGLIAAGLGANCSKPRKEAYAGFVWDEGLEDRLRVSLWMFIEEKQDNPRLAAVPSRTSPKV
jgi:hypothetical protein